MMAPSTAYFIMAKYPHVIHFIYPHIIPSITIVLWLVINEGDLRDLPDDFLAVGIMKWGQNGAPEEAHSMDGNMTWNCVSIYLHLAAVFFFFLL